MISPTLKRSEFPSPNTRLLSLPPVESALAPAHVKQPYGRSADEQRHNSGQGEEAEKPPVLGSSVPSGMVSRITSSLVEVLSPAVVCSHAPRVSP